jgi:hypothetical protein
MCYLKDPSVRVYSSSTVPLDSNTPSLNNQYDTAYTWEVVVPCLPTYAYHANPTWKINLLSFITILSKLLH